MNLTPEQAAAMRAKLEAKGVAQDRPKGIWLRPKDWAAIKAFPKRIRQDTKPRLNKLEQEWFDRIKGMFPNFPPVRAQAKRYELASGAWFKPDFTASTWPAPENGPQKETAWEVKGPKACRWSRRGELTIKFAARAWPEVRWILVWKEGGAWRTQEVLP